MSLSPPQHIPLVPETPALPFVRQKDDYSCGPACLGTVANIYDIGGVGYDMFRRILEPDPGVGSCNFKMADVSRAHLPFFSTGENTYHGGIAVANIMQEGEGHYVVFLCREDARVLYYDPYHHQLVIDRLDDLEWISESRHLTRWSVNYEPLAKNSFARWQALAA